jgi:LacI family transcriptional regulator
LIDANHFLIDVYQNVGRMVVGGMRVRKPTLHDVARAAGVSYATADRVLNERGNVAAKSERLVREAISSLGYMRDVHAANLSRRRLYNFRFILPQGDHSFFRALRQCLDDQGPRHRVNRVAVTVDDVPAFDAAALAAALATIEPGSCDCVALVATDSPAVNCELQRLRQAGIFVITLVSDASSEVRDAYVGLDNDRAGRTAGRLMLLGHSRGPGRALAIIGSYSAKDHRDRLAGFRDVLAGADPEVRLLPVVEGADDPATIYRLVRSALRSEPTITGIYSIGAGNRGLVDALREGSPARPLVIVHELVPHSRAALEEGLIDAVIDQKPADEIAAVLDAMKALSDREVLSPMVGEISPAIFLRDNLPALAGPLTSPRSHPS